MYKLLLLLLLLGGLLLLGYQIALLFHLSAALHTPRKWGLRPKYTSAVHAPSLLRHFRHQEGSRTVAHPVRVQAIFWDRASQVGGSAHVSSSSVRTLLWLNILWMLRDGRNNKRGKWSIPGPRVVTVPKFQYSVPIPVKSTVLGTNFGTKAKHKNMLIKKHIFINKVKQK